MLRCPGSLGIWTPYLAPYLLCAWSLPESFEDPVSLEARCILLIQTAVGDREWEGIRRQMPLEAEQPCTTRKKTPSMLKDKRGWKTRKEKDPNMLCAP